MELKWKPKKNRRLPTITGFLSFLLGLLALAVLNVVFMTQAENLPDFFLIHLPVIGIVLGIAGLFTIKHSRFFAIWGISIHVFVLLYLFIMFGLAYTVNPTP
ncbi:hypothetical protein [Bacillus massiliigorillae]|uniref:hypothetical protein n=1 Tax=Bacillus massiliigorillae TaxID=1243664 RepID=UPI00039C28C8|nr:hypothetical protein [Bacillus massiliigorillae]